MSISGEAGSLRALVRAEPLDGVPVLLWKHFRIDEPRQLARRTVDFYRRHRLSAAKIMPDIPLLFEDRSLSSWSQVAQLRRFGPAVTTGRAAEYVRTVELVRRGAGPPGHGAGHDLLAAGVDRALVWSGRAARDGPGGSGGCPQRPLRPRRRGQWPGAGVCGGRRRRHLLLLLGQDVLSAEEYSELGVPYDLAGLRGAAAAEFRLLHLHGRVDDVERYAGYPVQVAGWSEVESPLSLEDGARSLPGKFIMGGIAENRSGPADEATTARVAALAERFGPRFVLAPGCSLPDGTGDDALASLRALAGA